MEQTFEARFLSARRAVIAARFQNLNEMQREGVLTTQGPLLLLAGAGSGKTTVLINRIANLIAFGEGSDSNEIPEYIAEADVTYLEDYLKTRDPAMQQQAERLCALRPAAPWSILAITFTNKAANELKARLQALLGDYAMDVWAMTFHAACCRILRREIDRLDGYTGRFTIYDTSDSERVMKDILKDFGLDEKSLPPRLALSVISKAKDKRQGPEQFSKHAGKSGDYRMDRIAQLYAEYEKRLHEANALDFDDIILKTVELLEQFEDVRTYYQRKFHYVMIDEYQDTNQLQYQLTALLAGGYENICVVGDDDQSIYKFRGATIENILSFEKQFKGARVIRLEQNYRSTQAILNAANAVISHNRGRKGKKLWTQNAAGDRITVYEASSESDEANYIASRIISMSKGKNFKDFAVLYRTNAQSNAVENAFKRSGIPYRIIGGTRFFDRAEVKDMLAYLCVINNRADELRLQRIINNPPRGIGGKTLEMAQRQAAAAGVPLYTVVSDPYSYPSLEKSAAQLRPYGAQGIRARVVARKRCELYVVMVGRTYAVRPRGYQPEAPLHRGSPAPELAVPRNRAFLDVRGCRRYAREMRVRQVRLQIRRRTQSPVVGGRGRRGPVPPRQLCRALLRARGIALLYGNHPAYIAHRFFPVADPPSRSAPFILTFN